MRHMALFTVQFRVLLTASLMSCCVLGGCESANSARKPSADSPGVIYAVPQSQAFAIVRAAILSSAPRCGADELHIEKMRRGDGMRGYEADYASVFYHFFIVRRVYVVPAAGIAASGRQIDGFRFEIIDCAFRGWMPVQNRLPEGGCEKTLTSALLAALGATGTATPVTSLETRPYAP